MSTLARCPHYDRPCRTPRTMAGEIERIRELGETRASRRVEDRLRRSANSRKPWPASAHNPGLQRTPPPAAAPTFGWGILTCIFGVSLVMPWRAGSSAG